VSGSPRPIAVVTDYGLTDEFVGILHLVVARTAPGAQVIDLTHEIPPHDVRAGALTLWRAVPWLAPAVVLAVVDPGVGGGRRAAAPHNHPPPPSAPTTAFSSPPPSPPAGSPGPSPSPIRPGTCTPRATPNGARPLPGATSSPRWRPI
jgi:hypothetical protein